MNLDQRIAWIKGLNLQPKEEGMAETVAAVEAYGELFAGVRIDVDWETFIAGLPEGSPCTSL